MDADAPHPHCPFCGLPMRFRRPPSNDGLGSVFPSFDCNWCGVVLNVSARAEILELASPALAPA
jgi:transposase-like protein